MIKEFVKAAMPYPALRGLYEALEFVGNRTLRETLAGNSAFKLQYAGQRCFILGNGPSLGSERLEYLRDEIVFTCNNIGKSETIRHITPFAHFIMDKRMVDDRWPSEQNARIVENVRKLKWPGGSPVLFLGYGLRDFAIKSGLIDEFETHFVFQSSYGYATAYAPDLCRSIPALPTVVQAEILAAIYMGFTEIYLLGCDCTGFLNLAEAASQGEVSGLEYAYKTDEVDRKIASHVMSQSNISDELLYYSQIFKNYSLLGKYCESRGIKLVNLSSGGILNELPRASLESVISSAPTAKDCDE